MLLETDASNQAISGVFSQAHPDPNSTGKVIWKVVDCHALTLTEQQRNWAIHDTELWAKGGHSYLAIQVMSTQTTKACSTFKPNKSLMLDKLGGSKTWLSST